MLYQGSYQKITVNKIATQAQVNHSTFYKHYVNKDELLMAVENDLLSEFKEMTQQVPASLLESKINPEQPQLENYYQQLVLFVYRNGKKFSDRKSTRLNSSHQI